MSYGPSILPGKQQKKKRWPVTHHKTSMERNLYVWKKKTLDHSCSIVPVKSFKFSKCQTITVMTSHDSCKSFHQRPSRSGEIVSHPEKCGWSVFKQYAHFIIMNPTWRSKHILFPCLWHRQLMTSLFRWWPHRLDSGDSEHTAIFLNLLSIYG